MEYNREEARSSQKLSLRETSLNRSTTSGWMSEPETAVIFLCQPAHLVEDELVPVYLPLQIIGQEKDLGIEHLGRVDVAVPPVPGFVVVADRLFARREQGDGAEQGLAQNAMGLGVDLLQLVKSDLLLQGEGPDIAWNRDDMMRLSVLSRGIPAARAIWPEIKAVRIWCMAIWELAKSMESDEREENVSEPD